MILASLNPVFQAAANNTELGWLMGMTTVCFVACFLGWTWWAMRPANREHWEAIGRLPLEDDDLVEGVR